MHVENPYMRNSNSVKWTQSTLYIRIFTQSQPLTDHVIVKKHWHFCTCAWFDKRSWCSNSTTTIAKDMQFVYHNTIAWHHSQNFKGPKQSFTSDNLDIISHLEIMSQSKTLTLPYLCMIWQQMLIFKFIYHNSKGYAITLAQYNCMTSFSKF